MFSMTADSPVSLQTLISSIIHLQISTGSIPTASFFKTLSTENIHSGSGWQKPGIFLSVARGWQSWQGTGLAFQCKASKPNPGRDQAPGGS